jgi:hypothetical protein
MAPTANGNTLNGDSNTWLPAAIVQQVKNELESSLAAIEAAIREEQEDPLSAEAFKAEVERRLKLQ